MALIGQYRKKIKSAKNIAKLTRAMQLVAASKMKKAQIMALQGKDYAYGLSDMTHLLSSYIEKGMHPLVGKAVNEDAPVLTVLIAPQKGLCGGLVTNLTRFVAKNLTEISDRKKEFVVVGNKAKLIARRLRLSVIAEFDLELSAPKYDFVLPIARIIEDKFKSGQSSRVEVIYADFVNTMIQAPFKRILLPLDLNIEGIGISDKEDIVLKKEYIFEPTPESIVNPLLEMYLEVEIYQILLEAYASEQSARMVAMKNATDNASNLISDLTIDFNKARQANITNEILDIANANMMIANA